MKPPKLNFLDRAVCAVSPSLGMRRLAAKRVLHEYRYEGAEMSHKRNSAPQNMSPNSFDVQRDRLQLMREAEDLERNFAPAAMLNRKYAMYSAPVSYHAQTGDHVLDAEVESYLNEEIFPNCDHTGRYGFFKMMEFAIMGMNRGGDYGFAFTRPDIWEGISPDEAVELPLKIQAIEPDRIGGVYQNVVSNDYVAGLNIGDHGQIVSFRVFHRSMTTNCYDDPVDVPADQFVHITDPLRIDMYRGVSKLATAVQNLRDLYEMVDFVKGKAKIASALTVFTNSNGASIGGGPMDPYATSFTPGNAMGLQQDIAFGQINHLSGGTDIKFPASNSPSSEEQALMQLLLKFVAMSYNLPFSFALDATAMGGVSGRLESEMAKAEFERGQMVISTPATKIKNTYLMDAIAKGVFPASVAQKITRGRWGFRSHPQPDLGREASANTNLWQNGLLNPLKYWVDDAQDPETVADDMARWAMIKKSAAEKYGLQVEDVFGAGPAKPLSATESKTESTTVATEEPGKTELERKEFKFVMPDDKARNDAKRSKEWVANDQAIKLLTDKIETAKSDIDKGIDVEENRISIDRIRNEIADLYDKRPEIMYNYLKNRGDKKAAAALVTPEEKAKKAIKRNDRHALVMALLAQGYPELQSYAISYDIVESGKFKIGKLPEDIQKKYYP